MEPVPVTRKVRRIVRLAVALVVGQAMLCAVIGWLTLGPGRSEPSRAPGSSVVDQMAAPPALIKPAPPTSRAPVVATTSARKPAPTSARPARPRSDTATTVPARPPATTPSKTRAPTGDPVPIVIPPAPPELETPAPSPPATPPAASPSPSGPSATPLPGLSPSAVPGVVQTPVRIGDECRPEGAYGRTAKGALVRCVRAWGHQPRWKIV